VFFEGAKPVLGSSYFEVRFINPAPGDPLPDLLELLIEPLPGPAGPGTVRFAATADGTTADGTLAHEVTESHVRARHGQKRPTDRLVALAEVPLSGQESSLLAGACAGRPTGYNPARAF
jgi:hypothetical protein